ncbi:MAG: S8 family serine peptidase [Caldilineaceae bacterium]
MAKSTIKLPWVVPFAGVMLLVALLGICTLIASPRPVAAQSIDPSAQSETIVSAALANEFKSAQDPVSFLIILRDQVDLTAFATEPAVRAAGKTTRATLLYQALTAKARETQAPLRAWLTEQGIAFRSFYLVNMIEVKGDLVLASALTDRPEVARLVANPLVANALTVPEQRTGTVWRNRLQSVATPEASASVALPYGLEYTHATDVWALGYRGQNIVVASQDTGVEWDHPALQAAYRGFMTGTMTNTVTATGASTPTISHLYNWFDAWDLQGRPARCAQDAQIPCDDHGHGTHTVGTMVGDATVVSDTVLGMAPDAKWIGCRNMRNGVGTPASYTACFEFFLAPYPQGGDPFTDGRPELAPNIINNSWGCPPSEGCDAASLRQVVETVRTAGQMVVASAGNDGSSCSSVRNPIAMHDAVFSVGAHNSAGTIASFSSRGPVIADGSGRLKPDISAPGVAVRSAWVNGGYNTIQGTSMASPHVAGAVALLWSAVPTLIGDIEATEQILIKSATPVPANNCGEGANVVVPNNTYGYGRLDILAAVQMAQAPASLAITVANSSGVLLTERLVTVTDKLTGYQYQATTGFNGIARFIRIYAGEYRVETTDGIQAQSVTLGSSGQAQTELTVTTTINIYLPLVVK